MKESLLALSLFVLGGFTFWLMDKTNPTVIRNNQPITVDQVRNVRIPLDSLTTVAMWEYRLDIGKNNDYLTIESDKPLGYRTGDTLRILTHKTKR